MATGSAPKMADEIHPFGIQGGGLAVDVKPTLSSGNELVDGFLTVHERFFVKHLYQLLLHHPSLLRRNENGARRPRLLTVEC
jgi:hypothetical protein